MDIAEALASIFACKRVMLHPDMDLTVHIRKDTIGLGISTSIDGKAYSRRASVLSWHLQDKQYVFREVEHLVRSFYDDLARAAVGGD